MITNGKVDLKSIINHIKDSQLVSENDIFLNTAEALVTRFHSMEFRIVVVGEFSSGKSTFINALLSKDLLKHATNETTASITYIYNVKKGDSRIGTCDVQLTDGSQLKLPNLDSLEEYSTTIAKRNVVDEVESISIYIHFIDVEADVVIIDTPGLNGIADRHRELTIEEIKRSHACIYLFQQRGVAQTDIEFIKYIRDYQNTFIFIQNFIDELKINENETVEDKLKSMHEILNSTVLKEKTSLISADYCAISALKGLAGRDQSINVLYTDDTTEIDDKRRLAIYEESNYDSFLKTLKDLIKNEKFEKKRYRDDCMSLLSFVEALIEEGVERQNRIKEALERTGALDSQNKLKNQKDSLNANREKHLKRLDDLIVSEFADSKRLLLREIDSLINGVKEKMEDEINKVSSYKEFDNKASSKYFYNQLKQLVDTCNRKIKQDKVDFFQSVYRLVLTRMDEYSHSAGEVEEVPLKTTQVQNSNEFVSKNKKDEIKEIQTKSNQSKAEVELAKVKFKELKIEIAKIDGFINSNIDKMYQHGNQVKNEERILGQRPIEREYERLETYYEDRKGFALLFQWAIGQKEMTRQVTCYDDTQGQQWDKIKQDIHQKAERERTIIKNEINQYENKKVRLETECDKAESKLKIESDRIKRYEKEIEAKKDELKMFEELLEKEYLSACKSQLHSDMGNYLTDGNDSLVVRFKENIREDSEKNVLLVQHQMIKEYDRRLKEKQTILDQLISGNVDEINNNYKGLTEELDKLVNYHDVLMGCVDERL